jgi:hypothetical protein
MSSPASHDSLIAVGRRHWRNFLPIWLFPVVFFVTLFLPGWSAHPYAYIFLLWAPILGICTWLAGAPRRDDLATWSQTVFWATVVPVLIWATLITAVFGLAYAVGAV